jgi:hypothetical protein
MPFWYVRLTYGLLFVSWGVGNRYPQLNKFTYAFQTLYGFMVVAMLSGVSRRWRIPDWWNACVVPVLLPDGRGART